MIVYLKNNQDVELETNLSPLEWVSIVDIAQRGDIHVSIAVKLVTLESTRNGFIPLEDIDTERTFKALNYNPIQLPLLLL